MIDVAPPFTSEACFLYQKGKKKRMIQLSLYFNGSRIGLAGDKVS